MNKDEFNEKYKNFIVKGFYGLSLNNSEMIKYLDEKFGELVLRPNFKFKQIKAKFDWFCFYAEGITMDERFEIERRLKEIDNETM